MKENLSSNKRLCWSSGCRKRAWLEAWTGYRFCFKHWRRDYKYGSGYSKGLWTALKWTKIY